MGKFALQSVLRQNVQINVHVKNVIEKIVRGEKSMAEYMEKLKENEPKAMLTPQEYFDVMKEKKNNVTSEDLKKIYDNCLELANKYRITGQIRGLRKILFCLESIEKEKKLVDMGITTFIYKDDIDFYIDTIANTRNRRERPVKIIELERYEREIPDEIVDVIVKTKELFDQMYVVYTDYTGKEERKVEAERKQKDPILFGTFQNREKKVCIDRFYYLGDWVDEFCDLTLDKMVNETKRLGRNIVRTITTPKDVEELRKYIDAHYEVEKDSISKIIRKADADLNQKRNLFSKVKAVFSRKK